MNAFDINDLLYSSLLRVAKDPYHAPTPLEHTVHIPGPNYDIKIDYNSGECSYRIGSRLYDYVILTGHSLPLTDRDVQNVVNRIKSDAAREYQIDKRIQQATRDYETKQKKAHKHEMLSIKYQYDDVKLSSGDIEFLIALRKLSDLAKSLYDQEKKHFHDNDGNYVTDEDVAKLKDLVDNLSIASGYTSYQVGWNDGYDRGHGNDDEDTHDNSMSSYIDYESGFESGAHEGFLES